MAIHRYFERGEDQTEGYVLPDACPLCGNEAIVKVSALETGGYTGVHHLSAPRKPEPPIPPRPLIFKIYREREVRIYETLASIFVCRSEMWLRQFDVWDRCYFCPRCDAVFDAKTRFSLQRRSAERMWAC